MKLFIREHRLLILIQFTQLAIIVGIFWLAGFRDWALIIYSVSLALLFLLCYLIYYYMSRKKMYDRLSTHYTSLDDVFQSLGHAPISDALHKLLMSQYSTYEKRMIELQTKQQEHLIFMDRWVHQMKTPLSVIELMAQDLDEPESSNMREETERMKTGLNMVLSMARLRTMDRDFQPKRIRLVNIIKEVNKENRRFFIRNNIFPKVIERDEDVFVETDEKWLDFIVSQLVHNAVKYSTGKGEHIEIVIYKEKESSILEVRDFGIGIPQSDLKRIFDPFFTGENGRKYRESTGVGLFLVHEICTYLGHHIDVISKVGSGTTIRVLF